MVSSIFRTHTAPRKVPSNLQASERERERVLRLCVFLISPFYENCATWQAAVLSNVQLDVEAANLVERYRGVGRD